MPNFRVKCLIQGHRWLVVLGEFGRTRSFPELGRSFSHPSRWLPENAQSFAGIVPSIQVSQKWSCCYSPSCVLASFQVIRRCSALRLSSYSLKPLVVSGGSVLWGSRSSFWSCRCIYSVGTLHVQLFSLSLLWPFFLSSLVSQFSGVLARGLPLPSGLGCRVCLPRQVDRLQAVWAVGQRTYARMSCPHARCVLRPKGRGYYSISIYLLYSA